MESELLRIAKSSVDTDTFVNFTDDENINELLNNLEELPHAFVLGCVMDKQIPAHRAWAIPYKIYQELGNFDIDFLAEVPEEKYKKLFNEGKYHRFNDQCAGFFYEAVQKIKNDYDGDASRIWSDNPSSNDVVSRFKDFKGVGPNIAAMAAKILATGFKIKMSDYSAIDVSLDVHVVRVMKRLFFDDDATDDQITEKAREINPEFPGIIDSTCFFVGRDYCRPEKTDCQNCPLNKECKYNFRNGLAKVSNIGNKISLREDLQKVLDEYLDSKEQIRTTSAPIAHYITNDMRQHIDEILDSDKYFCGSSAGKGNLAEVPRVDFGIKNKTNKNHVDVAYLFKSDMSGVYLVLRTFYTENSVDKYGKYLLEHLKTKSKHIKDFIDRYGLKTDEYQESIDLLSNNNTAERYTAGTIYSKFYEKSDIPSDEILEKDLFDFLNMFEIVLDNYSDNMYLTVDEWIEALEDENLIDSLMINVLEIMHNFENNTACFDDIAKERHKFGHFDEKPMTYNWPIVHTSKRLKKHFNKTALYNKDDKEEWWSRLFYGEFKKHESGRRLFYFTIREELVEALEKYDKSKRNDLEKDNMINNKDFDSFYDYLLDKGYYFDKETIENYLLSLKVKPFVILTGNSGTGKTKLSQLFARYLNQKDNYKIIPVGANWTENRHILGFFNILENEAQYTPAYYLIENSHKNPYPHFLILDEMNLSHVERYFADFLSAIESKENIPLHGEDELEIPDNLFIVGTVNVDETTYMFSPKVLDRANTIEFETYSAKDYMTNKFNTSKPEGNVEYLEDVLKDQDIQDMSIQELEHVFDNDAFWQELSDEIFKFQEILKVSGFDFGFRVINEIVRFMAVAYKYEREPENWTNWKRYFDAQIKQKMLPKLHGSQKVIGETLDKLLEACSEYPTSKAKLEEMINVLEKQRYVSFIN